MFRIIAHALWGKFESRDELKKFVVLALIFFCIVGMYWALRPLKESVFITMVGVKKLPLAKILSIGVTIPLVLIYSKLVDVFSRQRVFYILLCIYGVVALIFTYFLLDPEYGLANPIESPWRIIGWLWYVYVESFGSLIVALFWAIATDTTLPDSAKRGFPLIVLFGQLGNIVGPLVLRARWFGFSSSAPIAGICGFIMFFIAFLMWVFMHITPEDQLKGYEAKDEHKKKKKPKAGFWEGLRLLLTNWYLFGILLMIGIYEIIVVMFDFQFHIMARAQYAQELGLSDYLANYSVITGTVASLCVIFGINNINRKLGMRASLMLMPFLIAVAVLALKYNPVLSVVFWIMVFAKAVNYSLNQPTIKQLYIPTARDARYKAQGWIDTFGARGSKGLGSVWNLTLEPLQNRSGELVGLTMFLTLSTALSLGLIGVWFFFALYVSRIYDRAIENEELVVS